MVTRLKKKVLSGTFVHSLNKQELEYLTETSVFIGSDGKIARILPAVQLDDIREELKRLGWEENEVEMDSNPRANQFYFPGFIDSHIHAPQYPNIGLFGSSTLLDWLEKYTFPLESSLADLAKASTVYNACVRRTLAHGTTTAAYFATIDVKATDLLADICLKMGQRAFIGRVCMDNATVCPSYYRDASAEASIEQTKLSIENISKKGGEGLITPILTPRFAPACSRQAMHALAALQAKTQLPLQTHISENEGELALVAQLFPECESYGQVYDSHGLLTEKTVLAHAIHLSEAEADLIADRGSKVSHCPCSNSSLTSGAARVRWLWDKGIDVGLGTDMSGGYSPSILEAARQAALVSRHVAMGLRGAERERSTLSVEEVLYLATCGGAKVLSLEDKVGRFAEGLEFDAQLIELGEVDGAGLGAGEVEERPGEPFRPNVKLGNVDLFGWEADRKEMVAKWLYNGDDRNTKKVWVRGRLVQEKT